MWYIYREREESSEDPLIIAKKKVGEGCLEAEDMRDELDGIMAKTLNSN